jgi:hypothetical protein
VCGRNDKCSYPWCYSQDFPALGSVIYLSRQPRAPPGKSYADALVSAPPLLLREEAAGSSAREGSPPGARVLDQDLTAGTSPARSEEGPGDMPPEALQPGVPACSAEASPDSCRHALRGGGRRRPSSVHARDRVLRSSSDRVLATRREALEGRLMQLEDLRSEKLRAMGHASRRCPFPISAGGPQLTPPAPAGPEAATVPEEGAPVRDPPPTPSSRDLLSIVQDGSLSELEALFRSQGTVDWDSRTGDGKLNGFHLAAMLGRADVLDVLLLHVPIGAHSLCRRRYTPLLYGAAIGSREVVKILLAKGAKPEVKDKGSETGEPEASTIPVTTGVPLPERAVRQLFTRPPGSAPRRCVRSVVPILSGHMTVAMVQVLALLLPRLRVDTRSKRRESALHLAAKGGHTVRHNQFSTIT